MDFRELYETHVRFVWRSVRRLGVPEHDAPDAVQQVFIVVNKKLAEFDGRAKMTTWLFGICLRVVQEYRRTVRTRAKVGDGAGIENDEELADTRLDPHAQLDQRRRGEMLETILDKLPFEQRTVFVLFELEGMRGEDIAELLGIPCGTVHSRLRLARAAFGEAAERLKAQQNFRCVLREA